MRNLILVLFALASGAASHAAANANLEHPSVHGMAVFGKSTIYLSHLPMFHSPHDYQAIFEAALDPASQQALDKSRAQSAEPLYTIAPESFVLPEMAAKPRPFRAQLFRGHFERDGVLIAEQATVTIKRVLYFRKFQPGETKPKTAEYFLFGRGDEYFLAHRIVAKPDFDQILSVATAPETPVSAFSAIALPSQPNDAPLDPGQLLEATSGAGASPMALKVVASLYLESGDLSF